MTFKIGDYVRIENAVAKSVTGRRGHVIGFPGEMVEVELDQPPPRTFFSKYCTYPENLKLLDAVDGRSTKEQRHDARANYRCDCARGK